MPMNFTYYFLLIIEGFLKEDIDPDPTKYEYNALPINHHTILPFVIIIYLHFYSLCKVSVNLFWKGLDHKNFKLTRPSSKHKDIFMANSTQKQNKNQIISFIR